MRIVGPNDGLRPFALSFEMLDQLIEGIDHMGVAKVPGVRTTAIHGAIIMLGVFGDAGVLFGKKELIGSHPAIMAQEICGMLLQGDELLNDLLFTRQRAITRGN